jgi:hypothetical protein
MPEADIKRKASEKKMRCSSSDGFDGRVQRYDRHGLAVEAHALLLIPFSKRSFAFVRNTVKDNTTVRHEGSVLL